MLRMWKAWVIKAAHAAHDEYLTMVRQGLAGLRALTELSKENLGGQLTIQYNLGGERNSASIVDLKHNLQLRRSARFASKTEALECSGLERLWRPAQ